MAERRGSDSDEYEFMTPQVTPEGQTVAISRQTVSLSNIGHNWTGGVNSGSLDRKHGAKKDQEETVIKKKKKFFGKSKSKGKESKPLAKSSSFSVKKGSPVVITSPTVSTLPPKSSQILVLDAPPTIGPKPPVKLSEEEERLQRAKERHREKMAAVRQSRLRRSSEPNPGRTAILAKEDSVDYMIDRSYGEVEVTDLINQYSDHLPLELVVTKGIYGMDERYSLSTSDKCIVHFVKRRDLVRIQDPESNKEFSVPVNSAIKFAIIYNPNNDASEARNGFNFTHVSDILERSPLPKMGLASLYDPNIEGLKSRELLVLKEVIFPENPQDPRMLRVYSLTAKCQRDLPETQEINMSTNPSFMQVYLPDILKHVPNPQSLHISMYRNPLARPLVAPGIPSSMFRRPLFMKKTFTDVLVIATGSSDGSEGNYNQQPFEIPTDIDVEFHVVKHSAEEKEKMINDSRKLKEKLKEKDIRHHRYVGISEEEHRMQMSLYKALREGAPLDECLNSEEAADGDYVKATSGNRLGLNHRVNLLEENLKRSCQFVSESKTAIATLLQENAALTDKVNRLEERLAAYAPLEAQMESLSRQVDNIFNELDQLQGSPASSKPKQAQKIMVDPLPPPGPPTPVKSQKESPSSIENRKGSVSTAESRKGSVSVVENRKGSVSAVESRKGSVSAVESRKGSVSTPRRQLLEQQKWEMNRMLLSHMGLNEVVRMLDLAGLSQYKEIILAEQVSGEVLVDLDDSMLERDLGIKSKIHRVKFLTLIQGRASDETYKITEMT